MASARDPVHGFSWEIVKLKLWYVSLDPESIRSGKILWPENETGSGFRKMSKFYKISKISSKIDVYSAKSSIWHERGARLRGACP